MIKIILLTIVFLISGCATTIQPQKMDDLTLCAEYGYDFKDVELRKEIIARKIIQPRDWVMVDKRTAYVGMPLCAMYAALGKTIQENRTLTSSGVRIQHVFYGRRYVYTTNGIVTAIQD